MSNKNQPAASVTTEDEAPALNEHLLLADSVKINFDAAPVETVEIALIDFPPNQKPYELGQLPDLIQRYGLQNPVILLRSGKRFTVADGRRRVASCKSLGHEFIAARVIDPSDRNALSPHVLTLVGNYARSVNEVSDYYAVKALHEDKSFTPRQIQEATGMKSQRVGQLLKLSNLIPEMLKAFTSGKIKTQAAYELALMTPKQQEKGLKLLQQNKRLTTDEVRAIRKVNVKEALASAPDDVFGNSDDNPQLSSDVDSAARELVKELYERFASRKSAAKDPVLQRAAAALRGWGMIEAPTADEDAPLALPAPSNEE